MTEPETIEFHERVIPSAAGTRPSGAVRVGIVAGSALLVVVGAVAAMGASPAAPSSGSQAAPAVASTEGDIVVVSPFDNGLRGGFGRGFHEITISAINGSNLSLETEDGWTRNITVGSSTTITKAGATITLADLAVGDQIGFRQERQTDGSYTITAIHIVLPAVGGEVTAVSGNTITVTRRDGSTATIHVDGDTTYQNDGEAATLADVTVGSYVIAVGSLRDDDSLDADAVYVGVRGFRDGVRFGRGFFDHRDEITEPAPTPTPATTS